MDENKKYGLILEKPDIRNFDFGAVMGEKINLKDIANLDFSIGELPIWNQGDSDYCSGYATAKAGWYHEDVEVSPDWQFAKIKQLQGNVTGWGAPLGTALKSGTEYGFLEKKRATLSREKNGDVVRNWANWDSFLDAYARDHKQQSYFEVKQGGYADLFDALRAALFQRKEKKTAVITGAMWRNEWTQADKGMIPTKYDDFGYGHAFILVGQKVFNGEPYIVAELSNTTDIGDKGRFYFPRDVINKELKFGCFMFVDMPKDEAKFYNEKKLNATQIARIRFLLSKYLRIA